MDLQKVFNKIEQILEERDEDVVAHLRTNVPHDTASAFSMAHLQGYAKAISDVLTIMRETKDEQRKLEENREYGQPRPEDDEE